MAGRQAGRVVVATRRALCASGAPMSRRVLFVIAAPSSASLFANQDPERPRPEARRPAPAPPAAAPAPAPKPTPGAKPAVSARAAFDRERYRIPHKMFVLDNG